MCSLRRGDRRSKRIITIQASTPSATPNSRLISEPDGSLAAPSLSSPAVTVPGCSAARPWTLVGPRRPEGRRRPETGSRHVGRPVTARITPEAAAKMDAVLRR